MATSLLTSTTAMNKADNREVLELKDMVAQTLTCTGVLGRYKAQMRASVYDVLHGRPRGDIYFQNHKSESIKGNQENNLLAQLILEYFDFYELKFSKSVLLPEANLESNDRNQVREMLEKQHIDISSLNSDQPILLQLFSRLSALNTTSNTNSQQLPTLEKQISISSTSQKVETKASSPIISNITSSSNTIVEPSPIFTNMTASSPPSHNNSPGQATLLEDSFEEEQLSSTMKKRTKKKLETSPETSPKEFGLSDAPSISEKKLPPLKPIGAQSNKSPPAVEDKEKLKPKTSTFLTTVFDEESDLNISDIEPSPTSAKSEHSFSSQRSNNSQKSNHSQHSNNSQKSNQSQHSNHSEGRQSNTSHHSYHSTHSHQNEHFGDQEHEQLDDHFENDHHPHEQDEFGQNFEEDVDFGEENWDQGEVISEFSGGSDFNDNYSDDFKDNTSNHSLNDFSDHTAHSENFDDVENVLDESF